MSTFRLPDLGEGLAEAEIVAWHVKPGDQVRVDQPMVSVETAKAIVEVPVPYGGIVSLLHGRVGDVIATGAPLIDFDSGTVVGSMPLAHLDELLETAPVRRESVTTERVRALPVARAVARHLGVSLSDLRGSGTAGVVTLQDVLNRGRPDPAHPAALPAGSNAEPLRGARRAMARSMSQARDQIAGSTVCDDADIHAWLDRGSYTLRLIRALLQGCRAEPALNAWYDAANSTRILLQHVDLAIAVDTPGGLIVPVLRAIQDTTADDWRAGLLAHKDAAYRRSTAPEDVRDFTLLLSNFGTLAGRYGIPLVVPPAVAILGAGRVREEAVVVDRQIVAHRRMPLSLSFDHRCVTGGEACRFLAAVIEDLEKSE